MREFAWRAVACRPAGCGTRPVTRLAQTSTDEDGRTNSPMVRTTGPQFGIMTAPSQVTYRDVLRAWPEGGHDPADRAHVAVRSPHAYQQRPQRADLRRLDTALSPRRANRTTAPRAAGDPATASDRRRCWPRWPGPVDIVSGGRLEFGIGVGSRPGHPVARHE